MRFVTQAWCCLWITSQPKSIGERGRGIKPSAPPSFYMKLLITITGSSRYNPFIRLSGGSGRDYTFTWNNEFNAHVWNRGFIGQQDSSSVDDIFATKDAFYRPSVKIIKEDKEPVEVVDETPAPVAKTRRPRKAVAV